MAYLESKPRYEILDGLRGVAALMIVAFHLFETYSGDPRTQIINHGYLAVDFFFALSGFVLGYAYDDRWNDSASPRMSGTCISLSDFCKRRIVRLHPLVILGGMFGLLTFYLSDRPSLPLVGQTEWWWLIVLYFCTIFMIPTPWVDTRGWGENFPINSPQWSLLLEYIANICYALIIRRLPTLTLWILTIIAAVFTIDLGLSLNLLGDRPANYWSDGTFIGGWLVQGWELHVGFVRLAFPFLCGLLLARHKKFISVKGGFWWCALLIVIMQSLPRIGGADPAYNWMNGLYETIWIIGGFPLILMLGAGSRIEGRKSQMVCKFLGDISFPIYITHFPLMLLQMSWASSHPDAPVSTVIMLSVSLFILSIALAYAALKLYDEPVREWLKVKWLKSGKR